MRLLDFRFRFLVLHCTTKDLFDKYTTCDAGDVMMANSSKRKAIGMDIVKIRMFDRVI